MVSLVDWASLPHGGIRMVLLIWWLMAPNMSAPVSKEEATASFMMQLWKSHRVTSAVFY